MSETEEPSLERAMRRAIALMTLWLEEDHPPEWRALLEEYTAPGPDRVWEVAVGFCNLVHAFQQRIDQMTGESPQRQLQLFAQAIFSGDGPVPQ